MKCKDCESKGCHYRDTFNDGTCVYNHEKSTTLDWQSFRAEAAKDILAGFAAKIGHPIDDYSEQSCKYAINLADELIKQLKEK